MEMYKQHYHISTYQHVRNMALYSCCFVADEATGYYKNGIGNVLYFLMIDLELKLQKDR